MSAAVDYVRAGLALVPIPRGRKGPNLAGWQTESGAITDEATAATLNGCNLGIAHRWCRTCCLDFDDYTAAESWLHERGINAAALLMREDAVQIHSGKPNRAKLLYRLPPGIEWLPTKQPPGSGIEFRCANDDGSVTVQDVLPPSIHPDTGKPYEWRGDFTAIPVLPDALLALWRALAKPTKGETGTTGSTAEDWLAELLNGGDLHNNARALIGRMAAKGVEEAVIKATFHAMRSAMEQARGADRVRQLFEGELNRMIEGARKFREQATPVEPVMVEPITLEELHKARLTPRVILRDLLFADVRCRISAGGTGKTTLALFELVTLALGRELYGRSPERPCRAVIVTREDSREILVARLREIMRAMHLDSDETRQVLDRVLIVDKSGESFRLSEVVSDVVIPHHGNLAALVETLADWMPDWIIFDPLVSFGVGESRVNDAEQGLIEAFRILRNRLDCCVEGIHHSGKGNAREKTLDQYSGRGGSALADGSRMVVVMQPLDAGEWLRETGTRLADGETGIVMALPKLSYAKQQDSIFIRRHGYTFTHERVQKRTPDQAARDTAEQVLRFIASEYQQGRRYCIKDLENSAGQMNLTRAEVRTALTTLKVSGRVIYVEVKGKSGSHFAPVTLAEFDGETPAETGLNEAAA